MKCLHILPMDQLSGAEKMALILCKNMKSYQPLAVCGGENLRSVFEKNNIKSYSLSFTRKNTLKIIKGLKEIINKNEIKILHAHDNKASLYAYLVKRLYRLDVKVISHIHNCYPWLKGNNTNKRIDSFLRKRYDYNIACGKLVYDFYKDNASYFQINKTSALSNAIDIDEITKVDDSKSEEIMTKFHIPKDKTILGFIGRLSDQKGIIPFIKELSNYKDSFKDCRFLIVGSGEQEEETKGLIKALGLEDLFILTGYQRDVYKFYPIIDILFLPSLYEGLPMVILEAMAFKKPIVSMDVGSISEVVISKESGFLVKAKDNLAFIKAILELKNNEQLISTYGNGAYSMVSKDYSIKTYTEKIEKIYDSFK